MAKLDIKYIFGSIDSLYDINVDADNLGELKGGRLATVDAEGFVKLAEGTDVALGVIVNDVEGYPYENQPALASGKCPLLSGGGVIVTAEVVESDIKPGDKLYAGTGENKGLFTKTATEGASVVGIARSANSADDKSLLIKVLV